MLYNSLDLACKKGFEAFNPQKGDKGEQNEIDFFDFILTSRE
jgi:hypothetical protein